MSQDYRALDWGCHRHGAAAPGVCLQKQQVNRTKRNAGPEMRAIAKAFGCSVGEAKKILAAARRQNTNI